MANLDKHVRYKTKVLGLAIYMILKR